MKYTGEFYNEGADKTNKKPIEVKEEIMKKARSLLLASVMQQLHSLRQQRYAARNRSDRRRSGDRLRRTRRAGG